MNKKGFLWLLIIILLISSIYYKVNKSIVRINVNKTMQFSYAHEIEKNKMAEFDVTNIITKKDISSIVNSLNNGKLVPDKKEVGKYTLEYVEIFVLGDRQFRICRQNDGKFTVMYSINPTSNNPLDDKQTTIDSEILQSYFAKFREVSKSLTPRGTWEVYIN